jgi:hypothetical protein
MKAVLRINAEEDHIEMKYVSCPEREPAFIS